MTTSISQLLKEHQKERGMSVPVLAVLTGLSERTLYRLINKDTHHAISNETVVALSRYCGGLSMPDLLAAIRNDGFTIGKKKRSQLTDKTVKTFTGTTTYHHRFSIRELLTLFICVVFGLIIGGTFWLLLLSLAKGGV